ncbi:MAG TPA: histidine kinase N-terminal 7TM domain-containing protein [Anaerolineaceae bacterium]|nr:histidine kinase N-terminal 7TM domain-containing protein [Anaerolineaceae bacterium]
MANIVYLIMLATSIAISVVVLIRFWRLRRQPGSMGLFISVSLATFWSFFYFLEFLFPEISLKILAAKFEYIGISLLPLGIFIFSLQYAGLGKFLTRRNITLLSIFPFITILLAFTNEFHHFLWTKVDPIGGAANAPLAVTHGWYFPIHTGYSYILLLLAAIMIFQLVGNSHGIYRAQAIVILLGMMVPWMVNFLYLANLYPYSYYDLTPIAFTVTNICFAIGLVRFNLLELIPMANETIINAMEDSVIVIDAEERVIEINQSAKRVFHLKGEVIGKSILTILPQYAGWPEGTPSNQNIEKEITIGEGEDTTWLTMRITLMVDRLKRAPCKVILFNDITRQKKSLHQILLQAAAMDAASNGIVITSPDGTIEWVNEAFSSLTGYSKEEAIGRNPRILKSGKMRAEIYQNLWKTILSGQTWRGEVINRKKDGAVYFEEMSITPQIEKDGTISHFIAIKQDVSQRKHAEEALKTAHRQALEANEMKTKLLANVSHDLRTPLGAIIGYVEMLQSGYYGDLPDHQKDVLSEILYSANELLVFVNNLVGQAQIETGRVILRNQKFDPCEMMEVIEGTGKLFAQKKGIDFTTWVDPELTPTMIGDPYWLQQIVQNLVNNALKFTDQGKIEVRLSRPDANHWCLQVADTGEGIPEGARSLIFEPFRQTNGSVTGRLGGSGLGLNIVREVTKLMSGSIDLQSELGKGSTFTILFPWISELAN